MAKVYVCKKADIPENGMKECSIGAHRKVLILESSGDYFACEAECPHRQVPLCEGWYDGKELTCPVHGWQWDIRSKKPSSFVEIPLAFYDVAVEDDTIYIDDAALNALS